MEYKKKTLYEKIVERWKADDNAYQRLEAAREILCAYFRPDLGVDYDEDADMIMLGEDIYEGSGPWTARKASTQFQGNTVSKKLDWFEYGFSDDRLAGVDELDDFRQDMKKHNTAVYQRGNFYDTQPQFTLDGWTTGSPLSFVEEDPETGFVMCVPCHWKTYRISYDRYNRSNGVIIKDEAWSARKCFDKFCPGQDMTARLEDAKKKFSVPLFTAIKNGSFNEQFTIWRAVLKRNDPMWDTKGFEPPISSQFRPKTWYDVYFEDTGVQDRRNTPLLTGGYHSKPFVHWDYNKKFWESASRTPAFEAIYDNVAMQQIFKNYLENMQLKVRPAMAVLMGMEGREDFSSEGINYINKAEWNYRPEPINQVGDITLEAETIDRYRENLSRHFSLDVFQVFSDLAREKNVELKVMQIIEIAGERVTTLLPMIETHEYYLAQVDARVRNIEMEAGRGPFNRLNLENIYDIIEDKLGDEAQAVKLQPEFTGTLRKTQQRQQKLSPIQHGIGALAELAEAMGDENLVRFVIRGYETAEKALGAVSFPQDLIREVEEYMELVEQDQQANAQREQFMMAIEAMKAGKGMDPKMLEGAVA